MAPPKKNKVAFLTLAVDDVEIFDPLYKKTLAVDADYPKRMRAMRRARGALITSVPLALQKALTERLREYDDAVNMVHVSREDAVGRVFYEYGRISAATTKLDPTPVRITVPRRPWKKTR